MTIIIDSLSRQSYNHFFDYIIEAMNKHLNNNEYIMLGSRVLMPISDTLNTKLKNQINNVLNENN